MQSRTSSRSLRLLCTTGVAVVAGVSLAACAKYSTTGSPTPSSPAASGPAASPAPSGGSALSSIGAATATGLTVSLAKGPQGIFLIGPKGLSLYVDTQDKGSMSACTSSGCATAWPALTDTGKITTGPGINAAEVSTATGQVANQVTYYGHLLYYFDGDQAPGQTNGDGKANFDLLGPFGNVMLASS